jgi:hypothetical protein
MRIHSVPGLTKDLPDSVRRNRLVISFIFEKEVSITFIFDFSINASFSIVDSGLSLDTLWSSVSASCLRHLFSQQSLFSSTSIKEGRIIIIIYLVVLNKIIFSFSVAFEQRFVRHSFGSSFSIVSDYKLDELGSILGRGKGFFL